MQLGAGENVLAKQEVFKELVSSVMSFDGDRVMDAARNALSQGVDPVTIIEDGFAKGLRIVGKKFEDGEETSRDRDVGEAHGQ